jgi:hypothetical protein
MKVSQKAFAIALIGLVTDYPPANSFAAVRATPAATARKPTSAAAAPAKPDAAGQANPADKATASAATKAYPLPAPYQSIIQTLQTMTTNGASALKTYRGEQRTLPIRAALTKGVLSYSMSPLVLTSYNTDIQLDKTTFPWIKDDKLPSIGETNLLCFTRQDYLDDQLSISYLTALNQRITALDTVVPTPTDLLGSLRLLFAQASLDSTVKMQDPPNAAKLKAADFQSCKDDLSDYDHLYYQQNIGKTSATGRFLFLAALPVLLGAAEAFYNSFITIATPVAKQLADDKTQLQRVDEIEAILKDPKTVEAIKTTGSELAGAIDDYATQSRRQQAGAFVEQLIQIQTMTIDVSKTSQCKANLASQQPLPSGAPSADFINCWRAAWDQLAKPVANLVSIGDSYDALADTSSVKASTTFGKILEKYEAFNKNPKSTSQDAQSLLQDLGQLIVLGNAVVTAASKSNTSTLGTDFTNLVKAVHAIEK